MRLATMLEEVLPSLFHAPVTERYPFERRPEPERLRGLLRWDRERCTGCGLCATDCPSQAIEMLAYDKKAKRFVLRFHADRCTFCGQCGFSCRQGALTLTNQGWELASLDRPSLVLLFGEEADVRLALQGVLPGGGSEAEGD